MKPKKIYQKYKGYFATRNWMKRHLLKRTAKKGIKYDEKRDDN